jgi:hypothetical protein
MTENITLTFTAAQLTKLKSLLKSTKANEAYFVNRVVREAGTTTAKTQQIAFSPEQFQNLKVLLAGYNLSISEALLDIVFDEGEPQFLAITQARQEAMRKDAGAQTGLGDLKEITAKDVAKAKKPVVRAKAGSRKAG